MGKTFDEIADLSRWELIHWMAHYRRHPWGEEHADARNAVLAAAVRTFSFGGGKFDPGPFYLHPENRNQNSKPAAKPTWREQRDAAMQWAAMAGGKITPTRKKG